MFAQKKWIYIFCMICAIALCFTALAEEGGMELPPAELGPVDLTDDALVVEEGFFDESVPVEADLSAVSDFPDDIFREYVLDNFDKNGDGDISSSEAKKVKTIDVSGMGIESLEGIEKFTKLTLLNCSNNVITSLDLSANKSLATLYCHDNPMDEIDIGYSSKLSKSVKSVFPTLEDGAMVFATGSGSKRKAVLALPEVILIKIKGQTFYDPNACFGLVSEDILMTEKQKLNLLSETCGYPWEYCHFDISNKSVLKVKDGVATASKAGEATVIVSTFDGQVATCDVTVMKAPSKVTLSEKKMTLGEGQDYLLVAEVPEYSYAEYTWTSSKPSVASVEDGLVTANGAGTATITVKTQNKKKATCKVTVYAAPTSIELNANRIGLMTAQTFQLKPTLNKGAGGVITLTSENPDVAEVNDDTGVITAVSEGTTFIWAETYNGLKAYCEVNVMPGPEEIIVDETGFVYVGQSAELGAVALTATGEDVTPMLAYKSSDAKVVSVTSEGVVKGVKAGTATITVSAANGKKATCRITVGKAATSITLNKKELKLKFNEETFEGESFQLKATLNSGAVAEITFDSDNEDVAWVDEDGMVYAVGVGSANITAETDNGKQAVCAVTVVPAENGPYYDDPGFDTGDVIVVAHKGGLSCGPENTLEAFANSASTGADMIELDVRTTKDGIQVINHDAKISGKKIKDKKYSELLKYKPDLCTLDEALDVIYDSGLLLQVELKDTADATKTVNAVREHDMEDRVIYISFEKDLLRKVRKMDANARLGFIFMDSVPSKLDSFIDELDISALMVHHKLLTQSRLDGWHDQGLQVNVWTIDDYSECVRWINMGVDYITSNYPEIAVRARG